MSSIVTHPSQIPDTPLYRLILEVGVELGSVEVGHECSGEHGHQDQRERVEGTGSGEHRSRRFYQPRKEAPSFHVAVARAGSGKRGCAIQGIRKNYFIGLQQAGRQRCSGREW